MKLLATTIVTLFAAAAIANSGTAAHPTPAPKADTKAAATTPAGDHKEDCTKITDKTKKAECEAKEKKTEKH